MRTKDLQVGVLYAYQSRRRGAAPIPVVLLTLDFVYMSIRGHHLGPTSKAFRKAVEGATKVCRTATYDDSWCGYLVASNQTLLSFSDKAERPAEPKALLDVRVSDVAAMTADQTRKEVPGRPGVFAFVMDPRNIVGAWEEVWEKHQAEQELATDLARIETERRTALLDEQAATLANLAALNLPGTLSKPAKDGISFDERKATTITVTVEQMKALLALVPDGAKVPEADWEYREGEGRRA